MIDTLSPAALEDLRRFHAGGLLPGISSRLLNRRHGLDITPREVRKIYRKMDRTEASGSSPFSVSR